MRFFTSIVLVGLCAMANANPSTHMVNTGHSAQFRSQDSLGNYAFGYNEDHATGGTFRRETGSPGMAHGSYGLRTIDGRVRVVNYVADGHGFRANIQTNEPGVEDQDPASVLINKAAAIVAPYLNKQVHAAPAPMALSHSVEAPVIAAAPVAKYEPAIEAISPHYLSGSYAAGPVLGKYEPTGPILDGHAGSIGLESHVAAAASAPSTLLGKYEPTGPILDGHGAAPILSSYTTKTYASPAPILSSDDSASAALASSLIGKSAGYGPISLATSGPIYAGKALAGLSHLGKK